MAKLLSVLFDAKSSGCQPKKREKKGEKTMRLCSYLEPFSPLFQLNECSCFFDKWIKGTIKKNYTWRMGPFKSIIM